MLPFRATTRRTVWRVPTDWLQFAAGIGLRVGPAADESEVREAEEALNLRLSRSRAVSTHRPTASETNGDMHTYFLSSSSRR